MQNKKDNSGNKITSLETNFMNKSFAEVMADGFKKYAKYIIQDRALPDIRDGLKPVQRRILFGMNQLGLQSDKPYKKSARTVGEVIGKYHPHGDSSIYEAMVRMSQNWKNNLPLVDMHGNNGSIDGDNAAAMRYTEARLSKAAEVMLKNIQKKITNFTLNFDDSEWEPTVLPSLLPNLLVNGATGIAAGYATNIPPHNLKEIINGIIYRIDNPDCSLLKILKFIPGPDFPTGGIIQGHDGIKDIYSSGRGKFVIRSNISYDNQKKCLIVSDIPFDTNKSLIIKEIEEIIADDKIKGIKEIQDSSDKNGVKILIFLNKSIVNSDVENIKNYLYKNTLLQINYNANMVAIIERKPFQFNLLQYLDNYINYANEIILSTAKFDQGIANKRLEIVTGLIKATKIIDQIVSLIRESVNRESAEKKLMLHYKFSQSQAEAIVQLRLYRLTNTDVSLLRDEEKKLKNLLVELDLLINNKEYRNNHIKKILREYVESFSEDRKTKIESEIEKIVVSETKLIDNKKVAVSVSKDGYLKLLSSRSNTDKDYLNYGLKETDGLIGQLSLNLLDKVVIITSFGNFISIPVFKIKESKWKDYGAHINVITPLQENEKIINFFTITSDDFNDSKYVIIATKYGIIKRVKLSELANVKLIKASTVIKLKDNDSVVSAFCSTDENAKVYVFTRCGRAIKYPVSEVPIIGSKTQGVKNIVLIDDDTVVSIVLVKDNLPRRSICLIGNYGAKRISLDEVPSVSRGSTGKKMFVMSQAKKADIFYANIVGKNSHICILTHDAKRKLILASSIPLVDTYAKLSSWKFTNNVIWANIVDLVSSDDAPTIQLFSE